MREALVHARLLTLLMLVRVSGSMAYQRELGLVELHRRLLSLVGNYDGLTSVELVALTGQEKAQISRAVKALTAAGLIERTSLRAKMRLSASGRDLFARIMAVADGRDAQITQRIGQAELARFARTTARLTRRAALMLADEQRLAAGSGEMTEDDGAGAPGAPRPLSRLAIPPLITLTSYLQRSATIAYRRDTGLSNFGWRMLSQIGEHQPLTLARLIAMAGRDKSQIGRAVRRLEESGAIARQVVPGRRDILLTTTAAGAETYARMCEHALARDDALFAAVGPDDRAAYIAVIERLTANAAALLAAERARLS